MKCFACAKPALMERMESYDPASVPSGDIDADYSFWCQDHAPEGSKPVGCSHCGEDATHFLYAGPYEPHQPACDECDDPTGEPRNGGSDTEPSDPWDSQTNRDIAEHYRGLK